MKNYIILLFFLLGARSAEARFLHLYIKPAVPTVTLRTYQGLKETAVTQLLTNGYAAINLPIKEGLLVVALPEGQTFPLWVAATDTGYTMQLTPRDVLPAVTGSATSLQLYSYMRTAALMQQRSMALTQTGQGLADTAMLLRLLKTEQDRLGKEADSLQTYWKSQLPKPEAVLLWGNSILLNEAATLNQEGKDKAAKETILQFVLGYYAVVEKSDLLRSLLSQYLMLTESARLPAGSPSYESRIQGDIATWVTALKGRYSPAEVTNHIIGIFRDRSMWTLGDTLMRSNENAQCVLPRLQNQKSIPYIGRPALWTNSLNDSLRIAGPTAGPLLIALYDMNCASAGMEYLLMRRVLQEGYQPALRMGMALLNVSEKELGPLWQGMPPTVFRSTNEGAIELAAVLPAVKSVPSYWEIDGKNVKYIGRSYRDVQSYFKANRK